jgi:mRNA interferase RelE/StbE
MPKTTKYEIIFTRRAEKVFQRLPADLTRRLDRAIRALGDNPRPSGYRKLVGEENLYRIRVGDWRIVYSIEDSKLIIVVVEVGPLGSVYENL